MPMDVKGKVAVVTGASAGIGRAIAIRLGQAGCTVAPIARGPEKLDEVATAIRSAGGRAQGFPCDLTNSAQLVETLKAVEAKLGPVDILVNNAGAGTFKPMERTSYEEALLPVQLPFQVSVGPWVDWRC